MKCVICGCSNERPCEGGCGWCSLKELARLNCDGPLCSTCGVMVARLLMYSEDAYRFRVAPLLRALKSAQDTHLSRSLRTLRGPRV